MSRLATAVFNPEYSSKFSGFPQAQAHPRRTGINKILLTIGYAKQNANTFGIFFCRHPRLTGRVRAVAPDVFPGFYSGRPEAVLAAADSANHPVQWVRLRQ